MSAKQQVREGLSIGLLILFMRMQCSLRLAVAAAVACCCWLTFSRTSRFFSAELSPPWTAPVHGFAPSQSQGLDLSYFTRFLLACASSFCCLIIDSLQHKSKAGYFLLTCLLSCAPHCLPNLCPGSPDNVFIQARVAACPVRRDTLLVEFLMAFATVSAIYLSWKCTGSFGSVKVCCKVWWKQQSY